MQSRTHSSTVIFDGVKVAPSATIGPLCVIGKPYRSVNGASYGSGGKTSIAARCEIGAHVIIGEGTTVGARSIIEDGCIVEVDARLGAQAHLLYRAYVCNEAKVARNTVIGGFICERAVIGPNCRIFGELVHQQSEPTAGWDDIEEPSPTIGAWSFVGFGARVIGDVKIGPRSYVCAGTIVTRDVPPLHVAFGVNQIVHHSSWTGALSRSSLFRRGRDGG